MVSEEEAQPQVVDNVARDQFVFESEGAIAHLDYEVEDGRLILIHTEVPEELGGRGIAGRLVQAGAARAARDGLTVAPWCPYARRWLRDHPDVAATVVIDWSEPPR
jgi:predicted GNAT family acetyltransferase